MHNDKDYPLSCLIHALSDKTRLPVPTLRLLNVTNYQSTEQGNMLQRNILRGMATYVRLHCRYPVSGQVEFLLYIKNLIPT